MITLTCCHTVDDLKGRVLLSLKSFTWDYRRAVDYVVYCQSCADEAERDGIVLHNRNEEKEWLEDD